MVRLRDHMCSYRVHTRGDETVDTLFLCTISAHVNLASAPISTYEYSVSRCFQLVNVSINTKIILLISTEESNDSEEI